MSDLRLISLEPFSESGLAQLRPLGQVDVRPDLSPEALLETISAYHGLIVGPATHVGERLIERALNLRVIGCTGDRLDNIDVSAARAMGVAVKASAAASTIAAAEQALRLLLQLAGLTHQGSLADRTLGLIGFGRVGREVAKRARSFEMRLLINQPRLTPELALDAGIEAVELPVLLTQSDFVSLHVPPKRETAGLIGAAEIGLMRAGACLINTAHPDLVDAGALLTALRTGQLAAAATLAPPAGLPAHERLLVIASPEPAPPDRETRDRDLARQVADVLRVRPPSDALSLRVVPAASVLPHEHTDQKRVDRLKEGLMEAGQLVNPPIVTPWQDRFVVLDGATRVTAMQQLGFPFLVVQTAATEREGFALHTWYHAVSADEPFAALMKTLRSIDGLALTPLSPEQAQQALRERDALCYLVEREDRAWLAECLPGARRLALLNALVAAYTRWGSVERTLQADLQRLTGLFPRLRALVVFPQFSPETVFSVAARGELMPAGLTRFIIPGRILRLNLDLEQLRREEPLASKRAWFEQFLADKLARSKLRYYQEPVILLDD